MKTIILMTAMFRRVALVTAKNMLSLPGRLACKALIALALTAAVSNIQGQLAAPTADETNDPSVPTSWSGGPNLPSNVARAVGAYFPANGRFYAMGGRSADSPGSSFTHPFEYNPATNTWVTKAATYPDSRVGGMVCAVLTVGGTPQIYCVGGNEYFGDFTTPRVFSYNPVTDTITTLTAADYWPGFTGLNFPGGFAVAGNKLYIIGGFDIGGPIGTAETWQFDPNAAVGSRWLQRQDYPVGRGYVPAATIGGFIYTAGGLIDFTDSNDAFRYDPVANTWTAIANIPRATGETRGVVINNEMWVLGGGFDNPSNEVDIYNPCSNTWRLGPPFATGRRFFPTDTDGSHIWLAGGFDPSGSPVNTMEIFSVPVAQSAVSRKTHGGAGTFDVPLPLTGSLGIECRSTAGNQTMIVTFANTVTLTGASVTCGVGSVGSFSASGAQVTVNLTGVANAQRITVTLANVNDGTTVGDVAIPMGVLAGDTNGNGTVNAGDVSQTKGQSGQAVTGANFRTDVNANGSINAGDIGLVKAQSGTGLP